MTYSIEFDERALKEWKKLAPTIKEQFKKKLIKLQINPKIGNAKLRELKIAIKSSYAALATEWCIK